ncbi:MAG: LolA family protein [Candidatus Kapaibacteriales bacterium]
MKVKTFLPVILFVAFLPNAYSIDKNKAFERLTAKFKNVNAIYVKFMDLVSQQKGEFYAQVGGKYNLNMSGRKIICNGKTVWNYNITKKQVVISDYQPYSYVSLENFFLDFAKNFKPIRIERENNSSLGPLNKLVLQHKDETSWLVFVYFDEKYNIKMVGFQQSSCGDDVAGVYQIKFFKLNPTIKSSKFEFKIPKDIEVIDLR